MREDLHGDLRAQTMLLTAFTIAGPVSLAMTDRLLIRRAPLDVLIGSSIGCVLTYLFWLSTSSVLASVVAFAFVGVFVAPLYPIAMAQAYRAIPERSGLVNAVASLF